jgi:hypothetical protein
MKTIKKTRGYLGSLLAKPTLDILTLMARKTERVFSMKSKILLLLVDGALTKCREKLCACIKTTIISASMPMVTKVIR